MAGTRKLHSTLGHSYPVRVARTADAEGPPRILFGDPGGAETRQALHLRELVDPGSAMFNRNQREKPR